MASGVAVAVCDHLPFPSISAHGPAVMYSESDLQSAVEAGAISAQAADALRDHVAQLRASPGADEEQVRLITGFNDIFVSIASVIMLVAVGWLGESSGWHRPHAPSPLTGGLVAAASWALAEYFTRARRMALPSILLLIGFVGGFAFSLVSLVALIAPGAGERTGALIAAGIAALTAAAAYLHWRRFMVPITIAACTAAAAAIIIALLVAAIPALSEHLVWLLLPGGIAIFLFAMHWDVGDRLRRTRRADVAFWLHLTAAPMIAHSLFQMLGAFDGQLGIGTALLVLLLYILFGLIALAIDRRALLVSSLAYVLYALSVLFRTAGAVELSMALTALVIGSALLFLSAFWIDARRRVVALLPVALQDRLPPAEPRLEISPRSAA